MSREPFAMVPEQAITEMRCAMCLRIYCFLDLRQGSNGRPVRSIRYVGRELDVKTDTVRRHLEDHLEPLGWVHLSREKEHGSTVIDVVHNPSRKRHGAVSAASADSLADATRRRSADGSLPRTGPRTPGVPTRERAARRMGDPDSGSPDDRSGDPDSGSLRTPDAGHHSGPSGGSLPRSMRSGSGLPDCSAPSDGPETVTEKEALEQVWRHLVEQGADDTTATQLSTLVVQGRPFEPGDRINVDYLRQLRAEATGRLKAVRDRQAGWR